MSITTDFVNLTDSYFSHIISPIAFGAVGDGVTDDAAAINAMLDFIRNAANVITDPVTSLGRFIQYTVDGGGRNYCVKTSLNFTDISGNMGGVSFQNLVFIWEGDALSTVLDMAGSRHLRFINVHVWNTVSFPTKIGWQQCRTSVGGVAAGHSFSMCTVRGYFTVCGWMNYSSEICAYWKCEIWNYANAANSYAMVLQGTNYIAPVSAYQTLATGTVPLNGPVFTECEFRRDPGVTEPTSAALLLGGGNRFDMHGCYAVSYGDACVVMRNAIGGAHIELHMEGNFKYNWLQFPAASDPPTFTDFEWHEHNCHATTAIFATDATFVGTILFNFFSIFIGSLVNTPVYFLDPTIYSMRDISIKTRTSAELPTVPGTFTLFDGATSAADRTPKTIRYQGFVNGTEANGTDGAGDCTASGIYGSIISQALTTAAGSTEIITVTNTLVTSNDLVFLTRNGGTNSAGTPNVRATVSNGSWALAITNAHASAAFNGTFIYAYQVVKRAI